MFRIRWSFNQAHFITFSWTCPNFKTEKRTLTPMNSKRTFWQRKFDSNWEIPKLVYEPCEISKRATLAWLTLWCMWDWRFTGKWSRKTDIFNTGFFFLFKDSLYFDPVLKALHEDIAEQEHFINTTIRLGLPAMQSVNELQQNYLVNIKVYHIIAE